MLSGVDAMCKCTLFIPYGCSLACILVAKGDVWLSGGAVCEVKIVYLRWLNKVVEKSLSLVYDYEKR